MSYQGCVVMMKGKSAKEFQVKCRLPGEPAGKADAILLQVT
jgi:hypothetical protein